MATRDTVIEALDGCIYENFADLFVLEDELKRIEKKFGLDDPEVIAALARYADVAPVQRRLSEREPHFLSHGLALALDDDGLRPPARVLVRALFQQAVLAAPDRVRSLPQSARMLAEQLLAESGRSLPAASWTSPWPAPGTKKAKPKKVAIPELPAHVERLVLAQPPEARPDRDRDAQLEETWRKNTYGDKRGLWPLHEMSDAAVRRIWKDLEPRNTWSWEDLPRLVPRMGVAGLDVSLKLVAEHQGELVALADVDSPRAAPLMANGFAGRPALKTVARAWFDRFPETAALGLVPLVIGGDRVGVQRALDALLHLRRAHPDALARALKRYDDEVREAVTALLARGVELPARKPALPLFAAPDRLPSPITADGRAALTGEALGELLLLLKVTPLGGAPWIEDLRQAFSATSLSRLARALVEAWLAAAAPPKEKWALQAAAHFPDDDTAKMLAAMAAELAPRGLSARAQEMVEVLAAMHTRAGLKLVHDLSRKVRSKAFRARAELVFQTAAEHMGLTEDELAERLVPDYGLTPEGLLPVKEPEVRLELDGLKPRWVDGDGEPVKKLPEPEGDDELKAQLAELKKKAPTLVREIAERLERRMGAGRRMPVDHFTEVYLMHGLARRVASRLVWGVYDEKGRLERSFVPGAQGPVDVNGKAVPLPEGRSVGVVHPLELEKGERELWSAQLDERGQPFEQLKRRAQRLETVQALRAAVKPYVGRTVPSGALMGLEKRGWVRGQPVGGGCYVSMSRRLGGGVAELSFEPGIYLGDPRMNPQQTIVAVDVPLSSSTPPTELSELEHDLHELTAR